MISFSRYSRLCHVMAGFLLLGAGLSTMPASAASADELRQADWPQIRREARGEDVYFHAWGGSGPINAYIRDQARQAEGEEGIHVHHVRVEDIAQSVGTLLATETAGREAGSIDVLWLNGENFRALKEHDLLWGPFVTLLPNAAYLEKGVGETDFTVPTEGLEAPWGRAQLTFMADTALVETPPRSMSEFLDFARAHPGRVTYPQPPSFHGTTFLKQALLELTDTPALLASPIPDRQTFEQVTAPLWRYLDALHPLMWAQGERQPDSAEAMEHLLANREIWLALTFNPSEVANARAAGRLPASIEPYQHEAGSVGNVHFLAIPRSAPHKAGALVWINRLLSPRAQREKADPETWGDPTVLDVDKLPAEARRAFARLGQMPGYLPETQRAKLLPEPHPDWTDALEAEWQRRYRQ
ncbi:ABC transporter substrate-binding protein [Halomonas shantousis]